MSQIQIILPEDTTKKLKILATKADRSLKKFIPLYLNHIVDLDIIDVDERTGAFITSITQSLSASASASAITLDQLKDAGIKNFKLEKQLSPEEQQLQDLKLQQKTNNLLQQRERMWFRRAKEVMNDYWDDAQCQYFAHSHIYGDAIYHSHPSDPNATIPEADDSNLELLLQDAISQYEQQDEEQYLYQTEIEEKENKLKEPNNEYYQQVKKYCINNDFTEDLYNILQYPSGDNLQYNHDTMIYNAMRIPNDERVWDAQRWQDFSEYFK